MIDLQAVIRKTLTFCGVLVAKNRFRAVGRMSTKLNYRVNQAPGGQKMVIIKCVKTTSEREQKVHTTPLRIWSVLTSPVRSLRPHHPYPH